LNFIAYILTIQIVYIFYTLIVFVPIALAVYLIYQIDPRVLKIVDNFIGIIGLPLLALLLWFSHQTAKRIAFWHLSFIESFKGTFKTVKSYIGLFFR
jgi:hypothetical protein